MHWKEEVLFRNTGLSAETQCYYMSSFIKSAAFSVVMIVAATVFADTSLVRLATLLHPRSVGEINIDNFKLKSFPVVFIDSLRLRAMQLNID